MQYALVNDIRTLPIKALKGICPLCNKEVIAKCGDIKVHHWAHKALKDCDPWWESETEWHREWKNKFPKSYREVVFTDEVSGEKHRADIHTPAGATIEFQNSPMSLEEMKSRDQFYKNLIWVVNAKKFKGFGFGENLPDPQDVDKLGFHFFNAPRVQFYKKEEAHEDLVRLYGFQSPEIKDLKRNPMLFFFEWNRPHTIWYHCQSEVYFDFGHQVILKLKKHEQTTNTIWYIEQIHKKRFIEMHTK